MNSKILAIQLCLALFSRSAVGFSHGSLAKVMRSQGTTKLAPLARSIVRNRPSQRKISPVCAMEIPDTYGFVMSTAALAAGMVQWKAIQVSVARKKYGVEYPIMYEDKQDSQFNFVQRGHQNTLEYLPSFMTLLMLNGLMAPISTSILGSAWIAARVVYIIGYSSDGPQGRIPGVIVSGLIFVSLIFATLFNGVKLTGILPF
uniref:Glutathione transferase n=1 Tax=Hanusia phi TaxID=3032 RepID=A0A7S0DWH9_9CRYP